MSRVAITVAVAAIANALGWALPVIDDARGWQAFRVALSPLWPFEDFRIPELWLALLSVPSALTNVLFVVVAGLLLAGVSAPRARLLLWMAAGATLLNLHWVFTMQGDRDELEAGYFVWVASFALLALAAYLQLASLSPRPAR
jgi:hypothetical protein